MTDQPSILNWFLLGGGVVAWMVGKWMTRHKPERILEKWIAEDRAERMMLVGRVITGLALAFLIIHYADCGPGMVLP